MFDMLAAPPDAPAVPDVAVSTLALALSVRRSCRPPPALPDVLPPQSAPPWRHPLVPSGEPAADSSRLGRRPLQSPAVEPHEAPPERREAGWKPRTASRALVR